MLVSLNSPHHLTRSSPEPISDIAGISLNTRNYPNPGYLGFSSHATIYAHLLPGESTAAHDVSRSTNTHGDDPSIFGAEDARTTQGVALINQMKQSLDVAACNALLDAWLSTGVDLALATTLTQHCAKATHDLLTSSLNQTEDVLRATRSLLRCSYLPLTPYAIDSLEGFQTQFCQGNTRWEALGLFFTAVARAAGDVRSFDSIYGTESARRRFQKLTIYFSDQCLDLCISLDCLNDLQLVLQYENFIAHACIDGDQSM